MATPPPPRPQVISISPASADLDARAANSDRDSMDADASSSRGGGLTTSPRWIQTLLTVFFVVLIAASIAIGCVIAAAHARDKYWINIASSSWVALAWNAEHGSLYPPLREEAGNFGGTRYMPLHVFLHAGLSRITGEFLLSGRIIGYASALLWFAGIIALARQRGAPWVIAGALASSVLISPVGFQGLCTIRSDGLALALQLWALWLIGRNDKPANAIFAAVLCALAFLAKLTAIWGAVAIGLWLLWRNRKSLIAFVVVGALLAAAALLAVNMLSDGRLWDNFSATAGSGWRGWGSVITWSQQRMLGFVSEWSPTTWMLVPPAALAMLLAASRKDLKPIHLAWVCCCGALAVMFADTGVGENHILELAALTAACAGDLWRRAGAVVVVTESPVDSSAASHGDSSLVTRHSSLAIRHSSFDWSIAQLLLAIAIGWSMQATIKQRLMRDIEAAIAQLRGGVPPPENDPHALDALLAGKRFLSDDPMVAIMQDQRPVIDDAFMFRGFGEAQPQWHDELIARIANHEFDVIVLTAEAVPDSWWYRELFLGERVTRAIAEHYQVQERGEGGGAGGYWVYRPPEG